LTTVASDLGAMAITVNNPMASEISFDILSLVRSIELSDVIFS
jgi:hypothetical protein